MSDFNDIIDSMYASLPRDGKESELVKAGKREQAVIEERFANLEMRLALLEERFKPIRVQLKRDADGRLSGEVEGAE